MNRIALRYLRGISAIDLLIVFSVTSICVAAGTPFVSNYALRTRMVEVIAVADSAKKAIIVACMEEPNLGKLNNQFLGFTFHEAKYVSDVQLEGSCAKATVTVMTKDTGALPDPVVTLTGVSRPGGNRMEWACTSTGADLQLPETCVR